MVGWAWERDKIDISTKKEIISANAGRSIYAHGVATYTDIFGARWRTEFCFFLSPGSIIRDTNGDAVRDKDGHMKFQWSPCAGLNKVYGCIVYCWIGCVANIESALTPRVSAANYVDGKCCRQQMLAGNQNDGYNGLMTTAHRHLPLPRNGGSHGDLTDRRRLNRAGDARKDFFSSNSQAVLALMSDAKGRSPERQRGCKLDYPSRRDAAHRSFRTRLA